jgi:hypothetical protein
MRETITKLEAAQRQLRTAIRLFFESRDLVAILTLAGAVERLLGDLLKDRGEQHPFRDSNIIRPERKKEFLRALNRPRNFVKHAETDAQETIEIDLSVVVEALLFECSVLHGMFVGRHLRETILFIIWYGLRYPDTIDPSEFRSVIDQLRGLAPTAEEDRTLYLELLDMPGWPAWFD